MGLAIQGLTPGVDVDRVVRSVCPYCGVGCGLLVGVERGQVVRVKGDPEAAANHGRVCGKGGTLQHVVEAHDRATTPLLRESLDDELRAVGWDEALDFAASRLSAIVERHGPDALAFYGSGQQLIEEYYTLVKLVKGFIGTNNLDSNSRLCMSSASVAYARMLGADGPPPSYADVELADVFLILGANVAECHPILFDRIKARKQAEPDRIVVIVVDPRRTPTAEIADLHLAIRPGGDVALLNEMLSTVAAEGLVDERFVEAHTTGFAATLAAATAQSPAANAAAAGLPLEEIRLAARLFGRSKAALCLWSMGANQSTSGVAKNAALINLCLATGNVGRPGAGPFSLTGQPNAMGGRAVGGLAHLLPGQRRTDDPAHRAVVEQHWGRPPGSISARRGLTATELPRALESGELRGVWIAGTNPLVSLPNVSAARARLRTAELVVVQDVHHPTETSRDAHLVLPAAGWGEKSGTMANSERRISILEAAVAPPGLARPDWEIYANLAARLGFGEAFGWQTAEEVFDEYRALTAGTPVDVAGVTYARLRDEGGVQWPCPSAQHPGSARLYEDGRFATPDGRARFMPVDWNPPVEMPDRDYPLVLTTGRVRDQWHTMTRTGHVASLRRQNPGPFVEVHPHDAGPRGIGEGAPVRVRSRRGAIVVPARLTTRIRPGTVFVPFHWGALRAADAAPNLLTHDSADPLSCQPELKHCSVTLELADDR